MKAVQSAVNLENQLAAMHGAGTQSASSGQSENEAFTSDSRVSACLTEGSRAMQALLHANVRLVFKVAHKFGWDPNLTFEDCVMVTPCTLLPLFSFFSSTLFGPSPACHSPRPWSNQYWFHLSLDFVCICL